MSERGSGGVLALAAIAVLALLALAAVAVGAALAGRQRVIAAADAGALAAADTALGIHPGTANICVIRLRGSNPTVIVLATIRLW